MIASVMIFFILAVAFADSTSELTVNFNLQSEGFNGYKDFGFSTDAEAENRIESASVAVEGNGYSGDVYAYWNILSNESYSLELYAEPLVSVGGHQLDWVVSWLSDDNQRLSIGGGIDSYGSGNSNLICERQASVGSSLLSSGSRNLNIWVPVDGTAVAGEYTGNLVMRLESI